MGSILGGQTPSRGAEIPQWARAGLEGLISNPGGAFTGAGGWGQGGGNPQGPFADIMAGNRALSGQDLFGSLQGIPQMAGMLGPLYAGLGAQFGGGIANQNQGLMNALGLPHAGMAGGLTSLVPGFLGATAPYMQRLQGLLGERTLSDFGGGRTPASPFSGQAAGAALAQMANTGPNGDLYNRAQALLKPQVRSAFTARGLGGSGQAIKEESNQAQQMADSFAQRAMQERIGLLGQAAAGEGANASMTNALASWNLGNQGQMADLIKAQIQGALGGAAMPGNIFSQLQGGTGTGAQTVAQMMQAGLNPLQALTQGQGLSMQGLQMPGALAQQLYGVTRAPYLQLLQAMSGAAPLDQGQGYRGFLGTAKG